MKESFIFYKSFYESIQSLENEYQLEIYNAICSYSLYGEEPKEMSSVAKAIFTLIKANLDSANKRYLASVENGKKGGNPNFKKGVSNPYYQKDNQEITPTLPEDNQKITQPLPKPIQNEQKKSKITRFSKPTIEEIQEYCNLRNNNVNADKFFNYYESVGWKVGKNPMKDWKACVRTWERNNYNDDKIEGKKEELVDYSSIDALDINSEEFLNYLNREV